MKTKEVSYELAMAMLTLYEECKKHEDCCECPFMDKEIVCCYLRKNPCSWEFRFITKKVGEIGGEDY